ncbi:Dot/Icm secretion system substrate [Legionella wadsworthii]|uniref:Dot/Icm secretion system substrate n=1 Tax=Legionella wadsworthii TaxID=28088 RepID=A0A378LRK5_9GAMM|nr:hypothetical protein [Legionella wadsworthii]STY28462.1 Dot/Icm secretion system substrate [Legionella wadsworthii]
MAALNNQFAELVKQIQKTPDNQILKQDLIQQVTKMKAIAQENPMVLIENNPMALFHLADVYPPNSAKYKQTMRQAANLGCTPAMVVMIKILGNSNDTGDLKKAVHYLAMLKKSGDSYNISQAQLLVEENPQLAKAVQDQTQAKQKLNYGLTHRFFAPQQPSDNDESIVHRDRLACPG